MTRLKCEVCDVTPLVTWMVFEPATILVTSGAEPNEVWRSVAKFYLSVRG